MIDTTTTLGELVTSHPDLAAELERRGLDYCCGGGRTLADAVGERPELDLATIVGELEVLAASTTGEAPDWPSMGILELVDHVESTHHRYLHEALPRIAALVEKIVAVHGERHAELHEVQRLFGAVRDDLEPHLMKEERVLFPAMRTLAGGPPAPLALTNLAAPISVMRAEHDQAGELLAELRRATGDFEVPTDGCASYRACYEALAELESDLHLHVHKENNLLFPAVEKLESS